MKERLTIIDFVEKYTAAYADHVFLREKVDNVWTETTYRETREQAHVIGAGLMALGMQKGERAALLSQGRNLWVTGELGILYAGGVNVPLSIKLEESNDLLFRIQHSDAQYIMTSEQQLPKIRKILPDCPNVRYVIVFDPLEEYQDREIGIQEVMDKGRALLASEPEKFVERYQSVGPDDYANISYTSGTKIGQFVHHIIGRFAEPFGLFHYERKRKTHQYAEQVERQQDECFIVLEERIDKKNIHRQAR